jgi:hypothetical protein
MIVKVPEHRGRIFDANGVRLRHCQWADTETGEAVHIVVVEDAGKRCFQTTVSDAGEEVLLREWRQHPAPLRYVPATTTEVA